MKAPFKLSLITALLILSGFSLTGQELVFEEYVDNMYRQTNWGKNRTHFGHFHMGFGSFFNEQDNTGLEIIPGSSNQTRFGYRYKLRVFEFYAMGLDGAYTYSRYKIKQRNDNIFPDKLRHNSEIFSQHNLELAYYNRISFQRRGDHIGKYLDLGIWGSWGFREKHVYKDEFTELFLGASKSKTTLGSLDYVNNTNWGVKASIGFNRVVFYGNYRLSDLLKAPFNNDAQTLDPGRLVVGMEISLY
jgi:hypothetical protein